MLLHRIILWLGLVLLEWLFLPLLAFLTVFCWRATIGWKIVAADAPWASKFCGLLEQCGFVLLDIAYLVGACILALTLYRLPPLVKVRSLRLFAHHRLTQLLR